MLGTFKTKDIHCSRHSELRTPHCAFVPGGVLLAQDGSSRSAVAARRKTHVAGEDVPILDVVLGKSMTSMVKRVVTWGHSKTASANFSLLGHSQRFLPDCRISIRL